MKVAVKCESDGTAYVALRVTVAVAFAGGDVNQRTVTLK